MKYYIIAGEASGDLHGSNLIKEIKLNDTKAELRAWGGDLMEAQGAKIIKHYKDLAFMGFLEVLANLTTIIKNLNFCKKDILEFKPDVLILIDYPGFNLRIAEFAHENNIKVVYYISPQIWAWKQSRIHKIKKVVDLMLVILPFEKQFYEQFDYQVEFVGHPLLDAIENHQVQNENWKAQNKLNELPIIAILPGSRKQEISSMLPIMLEAGNKFEGYQKVIAAAPGQLASFYDTFVDGHKNVTIVKGDTYNILNNASAAMVTSGTATLEAALFKVPEVVCYKGNELSYQIAKKLVKIKYISLVNLIMDRVVVTELIQKELTVNNIVAELNKVLISDKRALMLKDFDALTTKLGGRGASKNAADQIQKFLT